MADSRKIQQLNELLNYDGNNKNPSFGIVNLLGIPLTFLSHCFEFDTDEDVTLYKELTKFDSEEYDKRIMESKDKRVIKDFLMKYLDYIDLNRLTLYAYKRLAESTIAEDDYANLLAEKNANLDKLRDLIKKYSRHSYLYSYIASEMSSDGYPHIEVLYEDEILDNKRNKKKDNFISEEVLAKYMRYYKFPSLQYLICDKKMHATLSAMFSDLLEAHPNLSDQDRVRALMNDKVFKENIDKQNYLLVTDYEMVRYLQDNSETISYEDFVKTVEDFNEFNSNIDLTDYYERDYRDDFFHRNFLAEFDDISSELTKKFLAQDKRYIDKFIELGLINREQFDYYFSYSEDKVNTLGNAFAMGLVDGNQLVKICEKYDLDIQTAKSVSYNKFLKTNKIREDDYLHYPIKTSRFRKIIPSTELPKLTIALIKDATKAKELVKTKKADKDFDPSTSTTKLYLLIEDGIIDESFIKGLYINNELSSEDMDTVSKLYRDYDIDTLYGFEQSTEQLATFYQFTYDDLISQAIEAEGDIYEDKPIFPDPDEYLIKQNYEFQRKMFIDSPKSRATKNSELESKFDYLILYKGIAKHLYHQGLIDFKKLKEQIDDTGEKPENRETTKMILNGEIAEEDFPEAVKDTSLEDNPLVLTQLYESGNLTYKEIVDKYLDGKVSYDTLMRFAEGRDLSEAFSEDRYIGLFSNAIKSAKEDKIKLFAKYKRAFEEFKPNANYKKIYTVQKSELTRNGKVDKFAELYRKNVIDGKNLLDLLESTNIKFSKRILDTIADLVLKQDLSIQDCELLFRDIDNSQKKRQRLEFILSTYDIPDEIKMKTLLDCYIENSQTDFENYNYLLNACLPKATPDAPRENDEGTQTREEGVGAEKPEQELMPYPARYREIIAMDPTMTSRIIGSKMIFHSRRYNKHLFEQIYTTKKNVNTDLTTHATYIVSDELVDEIQDELFERDEDGNIVDFDYGVLIDNYRHGDRTQISKTLHKSRTWATKIQEKITRGHELAEAVLEPDNDDIDIG